MVLLAIGCQKNEYMPGRGSLIAWCSTKKSYVWIRDSVSGTMYKIRTGRYMQPIKSLGTFMNIRVKDRSLSNPKAILEPNQTEPGQFEQTYCKCLRGNETLID